MQRLSRYIRTACRSDKAVGLIAGLVLTVLASGWSLPALAQSLPADAQATCTVSTLVSHESDAKVFAGWFHSGAVTANGLVDPPNSVTFINQPNCPFYQWAERMFQRMDANGDGLLNKDEMPESLRAEVEKWDTNKDGFIDLNEYKAYFRAVVQQRMAEGGGWNPGWQGGGMPEPGMAPIPQEEEPIKKATVYRAGNLPKDIPSWFSQYDTDGDGQIGLYEWKATGESMEKFRQIDRNNDGFLTIDEVMRYDAEQKKNGGGGFSFGGARVAGQGPPNNQGAGGFQGRNGGGGGFGGFQGRGNGNGGGWRNRNRQGGN